MKDYPFFPLYLANFQRDIRGKTIEEIGHYILTLMDAWQDMDRDSMPLWMQEAAQKAIDKSKTLSDNAKQRWEASKSNANALQKHSKSNANAMQKDGFAMQSRVEYSIVEENTKDTFVRNRTARAEVEELFEDFRKRYPGRKLGLKAEFDNFLRKAGNQSEIIARGLITALEYETNHREKIRIAGAFLPEWKNLKTWVNNRCWEQEFPVEVQAQERRTSKQQSQDRLMQEMAELDQMRRGIL